jgi:hypothetical protein
MAPVLKFILLNSQNSRSYFQILSSKTPSSGNFANKVSRIGLRGYQCLHSFRSFDQGVLHTNTINTYEHIVLYHTIGLYINIDIRIYVYIYMYMYVHVYI